MIEDDEELGELHDEITAAINRHPDVYIYGVLGVLETIQFSLIERLPVRTIDRSLKLITQPEGANK